MDASEKELNILKKIIYLFCLSDIRVKKYNTYLQQTLKKHFIVYAKTFYTCFYTFYKYFVGIGCI